MTDSFMNFGPALNSPLTAGFEITPDNAADLPEVTRQIRVTGNSGAIAVVWASGVDSIEPVAAGDVFDWRIRRVKATGTTATGLRGYW